MISFILQISLLFPLVSYLVRTKGKTQSVKLLMSLGLIFGSLAVHYYVIAETWEPSLYEKFNVWRDSPNEDIWKKKREALIKYHPDKLKGEEKELYADVFININNYFETLSTGKEMYDYYNE